MSLSNYSQLGNKYILLDLLGIGGMAEVYRCKLVGQRGFEKIIVLKKLLSEAAKDKELVANFIDEARLAALLQHENIGHVYDFGEIDGNYFIAMEYLFGKDLFTIVQRAKEKKRSVDVEPALYITAKICEGMGYAHSLKDLHGRPLNIIHRDLSPHNVFVTYDGKVKIIDFGVARAELFDNRTRAGVVKGKISYMSPEQLTDKSVDKRSDIFSIGILLYEMLSGKRMYEGDTATLIRKGMQVEYDRLEAISPGLPDEVYSIVDKALRVNKKSRYQSCAEMSADIDDFLYHLEKRPNSLRLKEYMRTLFAKEYAAEKENLIKTANKIDEMNGAGGQKTKKRKKVTPVPEQEDKTLIVDTLDNAAMQKGGTVHQKTGSGIAKKIRQFLIAATVTTLLVGTIFFTLGRNLQWGKEKNEAADQAITSQDVPKTPKNIFQNKEVTLLLEKAEDVLAREELGKERFVEASSYYQQALRIEPGNSTAFNGMRRVYEYYAGMVEQFLSENDFDNCDEVIRSAQLAFPGSERIATLANDVQQKKDQLTTELTKKAELALANNDLTTPADTSAYFYFQKVLEIDSDNADARNGLQRIADRYAAMAESSYKELSLSQAHIYAERGLVVSAEHDTLQEIKKNVLTKYVEFVEGFIADNNFGKAEEYIQSALTVYPDNKQFMAYRDTAERKRIQLINDYSQKAALALQNDDLTTPENTSAFYYYQKLLEFDSGNDGARKGLQNIAERYATLASASYRKGDYPKSMVYVERGLSVVPQNSKLLEIQKDVFEKYSDLVKKDLGRGNLKKAEQHVAEVAKIFPKDKRVTVLRSSVEDKKRQVIKGLRLKAQRALSSNNLTTPAKSSAYKYYGDILKLDSNNADALNGMQRIADKYTALAEESYRDLKFSQARVFVDRGLRVAPKHKRLLELKSDLSKSKPGIFLKAIQKNIESTF
jgi:serine/threonine protein kinase